MILELDRGNGIPWKGNYSTWLEQKQDRLAKEDKRESNRQRALKDELDWIRSSPKGRQTKSKARIRSFEALLSEQSEAQRNRLELRIPPGPRLGDSVFELTGVSKGFGDNLLINDLNMIVPPGAIVGIVGPNGAGKTTLFRMLTGQETPDSGEIKQGSTVQYAYVDQSRSALEGEKTVWEEISEGQETVDMGRSEMNSAPMSAPLGSREATSKKACRRFVGW